jgi:hypothetical protein
MEQNTALSVALILVAVAVLMQAMAALGIWLSLRKIPPQIESVRTELKQHLDPLSQSVMEIVNNSREPLRSVMANFADISRLLRDRAGNVDALVADLVEKSRMQVARVDGMVADLVTKVETTADAVQRGVLEPMQEASAIFKGVRAGLDFLRTHRRVVNVSEATPDEQLFI